MDKEKLQQEAKKQVTRKAKRTAKKKIKRIHPLSFLVWILALALGVGAGVGACALICRNDGFEILGKSEIQIPVEEGKTYDYTDKGVKIVSFGKDISNRVKINTNMIETDDGVYTVDASEEGLYYIIYTVDDPRYGDIKRVRTITVGGEE